MIPTILAFKELSQDFSFIFPFLTSTLICGILSMCGPAPYAQCNPKKSSNKVESYLGDNKLVESQTVSYLQEEHHISNCHIQPLVEE